MSSLALDADTGDLAVVAGRLQLVTGADATRQKLLMRLRLWKGEWFRDTAVGIPYQTFLGQKGAQALAEATLRRAITTCAGVASLDTFTFTVDAQRRGRVAFKVTTTEGEPVEVTDFTAEAS